MKSRFNVSLRAGRLNSNWRWEQRQNQEGNKNTAWAHRPTLFKLNTDQTSRPLRPWLSPQTVRRSLLGFLCGRGQIGVTLSDVSNGLWRWSSWGGHQTGPGLLSSSLCALLSPSALAYSGRWQPTVAYLHQFCCHLRALKHGRQLGAADSRWMSHGTGKYPSRSQVGPVRATDIILNKSSLQIKERRKINHWKSGQSVRTFF